MPERSVADIRYEPVADWGSVPIGLSFAGDATSVAVTSDDRVHVFSRGPLPLVTFDRSGAFQYAAGAGEFDRPHAIAADPDDNLYLVDTGGHFVQKRDPEGKVLLTIGTRGAPAVEYSGNYFCKPTDIAIHPRTREVFITDGYANARIHKFSPAGEHILSWGEPGSGVGQLSLPHGLCFIDDERVAVVDRENYRIQVFTTDGEYVTQWHSHHPAAICRDSTSNFLFVGELGNPAQRDVPNLGCCVTVFTVDGEAVARLGTPLPGTAAGQFIAPHGVVQDAHGDLYVAEVSRTYREVVLGLAPEPCEPISLRKWQPMRP